METTLVCTVQVTRIIHVQCGTKYPDDIFARHIVEAIKEECDPDDVLLVNPVQVFVNEWAKENA